MSLQKTTETVELSPSERFTSAVIQEFKNNNGSIELSGFQKRLIQNYFIKLDSVLKEAERKRMLKKEANRDVTPITWQNVNMTKLAEDVMIFSRLGLDPGLPNHLSLIPFKNNSTSKYDVTGIIGYRGLEIKAKKYGLDKIVDVVVELVYSKDTFTAIKKGLNQEVETYKLEISNPFNRGEIVGGFYYQIFDDAKKNTLRLFSLADIEKRKPAYASAEFWGGEKDVWKDGKKAGVEKVSGWFDEMCYKTIYRSAFNNITLDAQKMDDIMGLILKIENESNALTYQNQEEKHIEKVQNVITENSGAETINFEEIKPEVVVETIPEKKLDAISSNAGPNF